MKLGKLFVLMLVVVLAASFANAVNLDVTYVRVNGDIYNDVNDSAVGTHADNIEVERGDDLTLKVRVKALTDVKDVQIEADIYGYRYAYKEDGVSATSKTFDLAENDTKIIELELEVPTKMDKKYTLIRIRAGDEDGLSFEKRYQLHVTGINEEDAVVIKDYSFSPSATVNAGRAFTSTVKVENIGDYDLDDVKVSVSIPALNIMDSEYLDNLDADETETLEEFLLRIPDCAEPGVYNVDIVAEFDEYESTKETAQITVLPGDACSERTYGEETTTLTAPESKDVNAGDNVEFPIIITNKGSSTKIYSVAISGIGGWAEYDLTPGAQAVVKGGETGVVTLSIDVDSEAKGERLFLATVSTDGYTEVAPMTAVIESNGENNDEVETSSVGFKKALEIALVVLVIILIIVALVIGFNKLRGSDDEDDTQTYY